MAVTYGFYNALNHDRLYDAIQMSSIFDGIIRDGIFSTIGDCMVVSAPEDGLYVNVGSGRAWFNHTWTLNDTDYPIEAEEAEVVLDRIDAVILEVNSSAEVRANSIKFLKGTPSSEPVKPTLTHNAEVNQYALAYVTIRAGQTTIFQSDIENVIGTDETPFITGLLQQVSIETLLTQWESEFNTYFTNFQSTSTTEFNNWLAAKVAEYTAWYAQMQTDMDADFAEFDAWFQHMKDQLSEDAAGHLQAEIDALAEAAEKGSIVTVTTTDSTLFNRPVTISQTGFDPVTKNFDANGVAYFETVPMVGEVAIEATNGTLTAHGTLTIPYFGRYTTNLEFWEAVLDISTNLQALYNRQITVSKDGATVGTTTFDGTGHATFSVHSVGTYTVSATDSASVEHTADVVVSAETTYYVDLAGIPDGRTALPTDDIGIWLACAEETANYTTLAEVLADTELFARLCADSNACDYMARSTTWALAEGLVPVLTSDTGENGSTFSREMSMSDGTHVYYLFDDDDTNTAYAYCNSASPSHFVDDGDYWFGYQFNTPTIVRRAYFYTRGGSSNSYSADFKIQGSNDGETWVDVSDAQTLNLTNSEYGTLWFDIDTTGIAYLYYRLFEDNAVTGKGSYNGIKLQFFSDADITTNATAMQIVGMFDYCAEALISNETWCEALINSDYWQSVFNDSIPKMTTNTTPSGVASMSGTVYQGVEAYHSFNQSTQSGAMIYTELPCWIKYEFPNPTTVCKITYKECGNAGSLNPNSFWTRGKFQGSNDNTNWTDIYDIEQTVVLGKTYTYTFFNDTPYKYYRIYVTATAGSFSYLQFGGFMNFYGRSKTVEYVPLVPNLTSNTSSQSIGEATGTSRYNEEYDYWQAFSQGITSPQNNGRYGWLPNLSTTPYICAFHFNTPKKVSHIRVARKSNSATTVIKAVGSNDGTNWTDISNTITINSDTTSIQTDWTYPYSDIINITSDTEYSYIGIQVVSSSIAINSGGGYRFEIYSEAEGITIHSAANDTIYYLDGSTPVTVAVTDANGKAVIDTEDLDPGTYTLYSTVAKDTNNLSNAYSKSIKITQYTTEVYLMPNFIVYWYGTKPRSYEMKNGWTPSGYSGWSSPSITENTNSLLISGGSSGGYKSFGWIKPEYRNLSKAIVIIKSATTNNNTFVAENLSDGMNLSNSDYIEGDVTTAGKYEGNITGNNRFICGRTHNGYYIEYSALWFE